MTSLARTVLVTGSNRGLGLEFVRQLAVAEHPPKVIIATCRNPANATELLALARDYQQIKVVKFDIWKKLYYSFTQVVLVSWQTRDQAGGQGNALWKSSMRSN
ncbi:putative oxidoreductase [Chionoecetes opilio]|uniref:Putative oxidoreductase n=1 Tax=Chionoecetes opilio TaxID=41210 RepID=A0A8J5CQA1_CHIOP|nr:putative oxidoreductase [Chionoecetes opilio]